MTRVVSTLRCRMVVLTLALALLAAGYDRSAAQQASPARGGNPFDGEWTLETSITTAPGGVSTRLAAPFNSHFVVEKLRFEVNADGSFEWLARDAGTLHDDGASGPGSFQNDFQLHLRGGGNAMLPPETGGPERPGDRRLKLTLKFITGDGRGSSLGPGHYVLSIGVASADLTQMTFTSHPGGHVVTVSAVPYEVAWPALSSTSATREEIAPDVLRVSTIYEARRQGTLRALGQQIPVTEWIKVEHVRYPKLIPRG